MTPPEETPLSAPESSERDRGEHRFRATVLMGVMVVMITLLLALMTHDAWLSRSFEFARRLYYIPVVYAAFVFGRRGGFLMSFACSALLLLVVAIGQYAVPDALALAGAGWKSFMLDNIVAMGGFFVLGVLLGTVRDNEERRTRDLRQVSVQLEEAYRKLEERAIQLINIQDYTQSILRSITSGVLTVGPDGSVTTANPAAERMLGMSEYEMVPTPIVALFRDDGGISGDVAKVLEGRLPVALREVTLVMNGGKSLHAQASTSRMRAVGGRILGAVVTIEDVSDVKALTDQLIRADRLAAMGELTAGVAHEVRNPLGVIRASVQLLEDSQCDAERISEACGIIKQEIDRLDRVIKALLDFGRPSVPTLMHTDVESVLDDVLLFTNRFATQAEVEVERVAQAGVPRVMADPDQVKQVILNLMTNAVQAMESTGGRISIATRQEGDFVQIMIADTGPGIAPDDLPKVFDPFYSRRVGGTGLGLTIVHRIVDEHGGHIEVHSSGAGTTFTVSLPAVLEE